jgi:hypothetical protein
VDAEFARSPEGYRSNFYKLDTAPKAKNAQNARVFVLTLHGILLAGRAWRPAVQHLTGVDHLRILVARQALGGPQLKCLNASGF